jgi:hypothetical protein
VGNFGDPQQRKAARQIRNWNGYIDQANVNSWIVKVVEDPESKWTHRVTLDVVNEDGTPNPGMAWAMRVRVKGDKTLSQTPTPAQWDYLKDLRDERFSRADGSAYPIA